jgi:hypothetical protein
MRPAIYIFPLLGQGHALVNSLKKRLMAHQPQASLPQHLNYFSFRQDPVISIPGDAVSDAAP